MNHRWSGRIVWVARVAMARVVIPWLVTTLDMNCGYLCSFFSQEILCLIENGKSIAGLRPYTVRRIAKTHERKPARKFGLRTRSLQNILGSYIEGTYPLSAGGAPRRGTTRPTSRLMYLYRN